MTIEGKLIIFENIEDRIVDILKHARPMSAYPPKVIQWELAQKDCKISYSTLNRHLKNMVEKRILKRIIGNYEFSRTYFYSIKTIFDKK